jgi:hypothetical protein
MSPIKITPNRVFAIHLLIILLLGVAFGLVVTADQLGHPTLMGISREFRLQEEANIPSFFSALALFATALAALAVCHALPRGDHDRLAWKVIAGLFTFMAFDEAGQIHELIMLPHALLRYDHYLHYFSVFPYLVVVATLAVILFPFWLRLSRDVRFMFAVAGILYVLSAVGMEVLENQLVTAGVPEHALRMALNYTLEELGEMLAVAIFLRTILTRLAELGGGSVLPVAIEPQTATEIRSAPAHIGPAPRPAVARALLKR